MSISDEAKLEIKEAKAKRLAESPEFGEFKNYKEIRTNVNHETVIVPYSRSKACSRYCSECCGFIYEEKRDCTEKKTCPIWPYRLGRLPERGSSAQRAVKIRKFCLNCVSGDNNYILNCPSKLCPLHPYRMGARMAADAESLISFRDMKGKKVTND